jgi:hypothetical protein
MQLLLKARNSLIAMLNAAADALEKHFGTGKIVIEGKPTTARALAKRLRDHARAHTEAEQLHRRWLKATRDLRTELRGEIVPAMFGVRALAGNKFGAASHTLREFGFQPEKKRGPKPHIERRAAAVAKAAATRKARGTMGKKQRRAIKAATAGTAP